MQHAPRTSTSPQSRLRRAGALGLCAAALAACDRGSTAPVALQPDEPKVVAAGKPLYDRHCASCHGFRLEGQPDWRRRDAAGRLPAPPHDASGHTWHHPDDLLFRITKLGVAKASNLKDYESAMPAFEGVLSDQEIVAVLSWIKAQWPMEIRGHHDEVNAAAERNRRP